MTTCFWAPGVSKLHKRVNLVENYGYTTKHEFDCGETHIESTAAEIRVMEASSVQFDEIDNEKICEECFKEGWEIEVVKEL